MSYTLLFAQLQPFSLAGAGVSIGDSSILLTSFKTIDGTNLAMSDFGVIGFGTLEPGNGINEEQISFSGVTQNANGTATLTGVKHVLFTSPYTQTSNVTKTHTGGSVFVISNTSALYETIINYIDGIAIAGSPVSTPTTLGISEISITPVDITHPIAVGDNDTRVSPVSLATITADEIAALAGTGTPSGANKYVTNDTLTNFPSTFTNPIIRVYTSNNTWTKPAGLKYAVLEVVGGGAGGNYPIACGGGGGGYSKKIVVAASLGATETITIGTGGSAGTGSGSPSSGGNGGTTSIGSQLQATGGSNTGGGGVGSSGDLNLYGGTGERGAQGNSNFSGIAGSGGSSFYGAGGQGFVGNGPGGNGLVYGGGGGATVNGINSLGAPGAGASGVAIITEYYV